MRRLVPLQQLIQEAEEEGVQYLVAPEDLYALNPDELDEPEEDGEEE